MFLNLQSHTPSSKGQNIDWTIGLFLDFFLDHFFLAIYWTNFLDHFIGPFYWTIGRRTISNQRRVGGGCVSKCYWFMEFLLDHRNYFEWFIDWLLLCQNFALGAVFLYFFVADFRFRSSTVESRVCLLSRLVSVLHYHESSISCFTSPFVCTVYYY